MRGRDIAAGDEIEDYFLGGAFTVDRIDAHAHRTAGGEWARAAYDHSGRGLVVFDADRYVVVDPHLPASPASAVTADEGTRE